MKLSLNKKELNNDAGPGGLEILVEGCTGNPQEKRPGMAIFIEFFKGKVQVHVWDGTCDNPQTIVLH